MPLSGIPLSVALAKKAATRLYEQVALRGTAHWNGETAVLEEFRVEEILDYTPTTPTEGFAALAELVDDSYFDVDNPDHFLKELRE